MTDNRTNKSPWLSIWLHPRATIETAIQQKNTGMVILLIYLAGLDTALNFSLNMGAGDFSSLSHIIVMSLIRGILFGAASWAIMSTLVFWIGKLFRGQGSWLDISRAYAWCMIPVVVGMVISWPLSAIIFGGDLFTSITPPLSAPMILLNAFATMIGLLITIWSIFIASQAIGAAHKISNWKGFLTILIAGFIMILAVGLIIVALIPGLMM
ncbi:hypothetical protein JOC34_002581 [Virgibacillus halotolerans]|uniref:Yip1 family protein n=1 Tax=Virgibacillus halotolerans TaxID=1071053 RepID=UPI0019619E7C|nr:Yip1 family protein [Virgibacillus halotolerans]MBM7600190.1 hypothetical protein [Virgibacillus halotolerans]